MSGLRLATLAHPLLDPVDLTVAAGESVFLSGPSGSGKSLLLRAIVDLDPHQGEVWLGTEARSSMPTPLWRRRVGLLPAESAWWSDTVGEHLPRQTSNPGGDLPAIEAWLERLGFGLDALGWAVARLSTGERQRLALVRLLAQRPEALLLDEATANLDPQNRDRVEALMATYRTEADAAILWVSHDQEQRGRVGGASFVIRHRRLVPEP
jgi:putative ABC transport system ATP-binding protein